MCLPPDRRVRDAAGLRSRTCRRRAFGPPYYLALGDSLALGIQPNAVRRPGRHQQGLRRRSVHALSPAPPESSPGANSAARARRPRRCSMAASARTTLGTQLAEAVRVHQDPSGRAHHPEHRRRQRPSVASICGCSRSTRPASCRPGPRRHRTGAGADSRDPASGGRPCRADRRDELLRSVPRGVDAGPCGRGVGAGLAGCHQRPERPARHAVLRDSRCRSPTSRAPTGSTTSRWCPGSTCRSTCCSSSPGRGLARRRRSGRTSIPMRQGTSVIAAAFVKAIGSL